MAALRFRQIDAAYLLIFCTLVILCFKAAITGGRSVASLPSVASYAQSHGAGWRNPFSSQLPSLQRCVLPPNARWCTVRIYGLKSFELAVYAGFGFNGGDIVSQELCSSGSWEFRSMSTFGPAGQALDIGGNLGVYSFALAAAGWNVTTFEPMPINLARIKASLCRNPDLAKRIHLMEVGLGEKNQRCQFISGRDNTGDGNARCGVEMNRPVPPLYADRGIFDIIRLDDALEKLGIEKIDYVKLDVEGFECNVLRGGQSLFTKYRPRLFQSEVWPNMQRCSPREYLDMYEKAGYTVARDPRCQRPYKHGPTGISDYWMCRGRSLRALGASAPLLLQRRD